MKLSWFSTTAKKTKKKKNKQKKKTKRESRYTQIVSNLLVNGTQVFYIHTAIYTHK